MYPPVAKSSSSLRHRIARRRIKSKRPTMRTPGRGRITIRSAARGTVVAARLPRAKDMWGRVRAIGPNNTKSAWSDPATVLVT
jgi:hypothetical protein